MTDKRLLLERYEALGEETDFLTAAPLYERAAAETSDPELLRDYGYLLFSHARYELRRAVDQFKRAIELDPDNEKIHYHLISAMAALADTDHMTSLYRQRHAAAPDEPRESRLLACAYLTAREFDRGRDVIDAGLARDPDDPVLIAFRGEVKAATGDPDGALADWQRACELDQEDIGPLYSRAFLLEREERLEEAADAWRSIISWSDDRGYHPSVEWPKQELERVRRRIVEA
jgi:tetratricopeptide (TPR) repeat protein